MYIAGVISGFFIGSIAGAIGVLALGFAIFLFMVWLQRS